MSILSILTNTIIYSLTKANLQYLQTPNVQKKLRKTAPFEAKMAYKWPKVPATDACTRDQAVPAADVSINLNIRLLLLFPAE